MMTSDVEDAVLRALQLARGLKLSDSARCVFVPSYLTRTLAPPHVPSMTGDEARDYVGRNALSLYLPLERACSDAADAMAAKEELHARLAPLKRNPGARFEYVRTCADVYAFMMASDENSDSSPHYALMVYWAKARKAYLLDSAPSLQVHDSRACVLLHVMRSCGLIHTDCAGYYKVVSFPRQLSGWECGYYCANACALLAGNAAWYTSDQSVFAHIASHRTFHDMLYYSADVYDGRPLCEAFPVVNLARHIMKCAGL